ncbi:MAG: membrane protein insertase YidC, partial [Deltaproteobacteria bacterium]|nr:membrane protein insertase YidC [Deltaproteobacteria bacterium]
SFVLKKFRIEKDTNAAPMELVMTGNPAELPLVFTLDNGAAAILPVFKADREKLSLQAGSTGELVMTAVLENGLTLTRTLNFDGDSYLFSTDYTVTNSGSAAQQVTPAMVMTNASFSAANSTSRYLFSGPVAYLNNELQEIKGKKLTAGPLTMQGAVSWSAYEDNYFICAVIPEQNTAGMVTMSATGDTVRTVVGGGLAGLAAGESKTFRYKAYFGPKKLSVLKDTGYELAKAVNFGWFDVLAKPMLFLLNFFYSYIGNYGVAIILLTCLIKGAFWPITQKGMKSMKNMQKLQPRVAKLKEKFKDDPAKMNQEMMAMYKTYKVNPIGGCLPMIIQIPFFFALYRVLMAAIELRHAPFMLWINDLSAPDRLMIPGLDIPYLQGIPVLTLLMGASMYLQQKMTPTTADPTQARIMQFLPVIFTFMFINFASGLVLYWFVNNLLSILQQQLINRTTSKA